MTTQEKLIRNKMSLLEFAEYLKNVSEACRVMGVSRQHFYDIKNAYDNGGAEALREKTRRKPNTKNRTAPEVENAICELALEQPAYGQLRVSNELRKKGILISPAGVRSVWLRHELETFKKRLKNLEDKASKQGIVYTESQLAALERAKQERESEPDSIETHHPGYLAAQDTFYVGYLKGVGRIYQQTVMDTYSSVAFAKLYTSKVPVTAADVLNDQVLPFFEKEQVPLLRMLPDRKNHVLSVPTAVPSFAPWSPEFAAQWVFEGSTSKSEKSKEVGMMREAGIVHHRATPMPYSFHRRRTGTMRKRNGVELVE